MMGSVMDQQIRFCKTVDGVRIAYATAGTGPPLVLVPGWVSHLEIMWDDPISRRTFDSYLDNFFLIRYDKRGTGLSDRGVKDFSVEARVRDLEAVVDHLKLERFFLYGVSEGGPLAISYAARNPDRVARLALYGTFASPFGNAESIDALVGLVRAEWGLGSATLSNIFMPKAPPEVVESFVKLQRAAATAEDAAAMLKANTQVDVSHLLPEIEMPTLVVHGRGDKAVPFESGREIAGGVPDARLLAIETRRHWPEPEVMAQVHTAVTEFFLEDGQSAASEPTGAAATPFRTILFTDLVGHTAMMSRLGDDRGRDVLREHESITRDLLKRHGGAEVKAMGDGFMASFNSVKKAVECAIALQRAIAGRNESAPEPLDVRVGLDAGEPIEEEGDLFGATVILASRIAAKADGGEILVSDAVRGLCSGKGFLFADRGEFAAKGFEDHVRLYEVRWRE